MSDENSKPSSMPRVPENEWKGTYKDNVADLPDDKRLPLKQLPQGPAPSPFRIGG